MENSAAIQPENFKNISSNCLCITQNLTKGSRTLFTIMTWHDMYLRNCFPTPDGNRRPAGPGLWWSNWCQGSVSLTIADRHQWFSFRQLHPGLYFLCGYPSVAVCDQEGFEFDWVGWSEMRTSFAVIVSIYSAFKCEGKFLPEQSLFLQEDAQRNCAIGTSNPPDDVGLNKTNE